jgi:acyl carrier protein
MEENMNPQDEALKIIADVLEMKNTILTPETLIKDVDGWDSLAQLHIIGVLEDTFHVTIPLDAMIDMKAIGDILKFLN